MLPAGHGQLPAASVHASSTGAGAPRGRTPASSVIGCGDDGVSRSSSPRPGANDVSLAESQVEG
jgi:hypothetical protein